MYKNFGEIRTEGQPTSNYIKKKGHNSLNGREDLVRLLVFLYEIISDKIFSEDD